MDRWLHIKASSVLNNNIENNGPRWGIIGGTKNGSKLFISGEEWNPWWHIQIKPMEVSGIIVGNRVDGTHGKMFSNIEVRSGMNSLPLANDVVGSFRGLGINGPYNHFITFKRVVRSAYITIQKKGFGQLIINGVRIRGTFTL